MLSKNEHVVAGTGPLGLALINELLKQGKSVKAVNRSGKAIVPKGVPCIKSDMTDLENTRNILKNASVIYNTTGLPYREWPTVLPVIMNNLIQASSENDVKLVYADNLYAYGPQKEPFHENMAYQPVGEKTRVRAQLATTLMDAVKQGKLRATIGRGSDFYGPYALNAMLGQRVFLHLLEGKPVELIGNPDTLHSHIFIKDFARGLTILGNEDQAVGEVWHIPHAAPMTTRQLVEQISSRLSKVPKYRIANKFIVNVTGLFNPFMKDFKELMYQQDQNFIVDSSKFSNHFAFDTTSHEQAIKETSDWYINQQK